jgi:hypothetical protein
MASRFICHLKEHKTTGFLCPYKSTEECFSPLMVHLPRLAWNIILEDEKRKKQSSGVSYWHRRSTDGKLPGTPRAYIDQNHIFNSSIMLPSIMATMNSSLTMWSHKNFIVTFSIFRLFQLLQFAN